MNGLLYQRTVRCLDDFDDKGAGHGLAVRVKGDRTAERRIEFQLGQGLAQLFVPFAEDAVGLVQGEKQCLRVHIVTEGEQAGSGAGIRKALAVAFGKIGPRVVVVALHDGQRRNRARQQGTDSACSQKAAAQSRGARHDGRLPAGLGIGFQKALRRPRLQSQEQRVCLRTRHGPRRFARRRLRRSIPSASRPLGRRARNSPV